MFLVRLQLMAPKLVLEGEAYGVMGHLAENPGGEVIHLAAVALLAAVCTRELAPEGIRLALPSCCGT